MRSIFITKTNPHAAGDPHMVCLPLKFLPGWLFGISANRVREELRDKVIRYQRECYDVLWRAFQADALTRQPPQTSGSLAQIRSLALAIAQMAEQQMVLEGRVEETHELAASAHARMDRAAEVVAEMRRRLITVESRVLPAAAISDEQAAEISGQVKALAELLTSQDSSTAQAGQRQNHYQSIFAEIYRRFGVSSYKLIRQDQYQAVLSFLDDWRIAAS